MGTIKIQLNLLDGNTKEIDFGGLLYKQHQVFKKRLEEYIALKNIQTL